MEGAEHSHVYPRNLTTAEVFQTKVRAVGVTSDTHVILYSRTDKLGFLASGRAWWMFKVGMLLEISDIQALSNLLAPTSIKRENTEAEILPPCNLFNFFYLTSEKYESKYFRMNF